MKARRFSRMASRPCQSATPRLPMASLVKQSNPLPKVLSSISFQKAISHSGGSVFVNVIVVMVFSFDGSVWVSGRAAATRGSEIIAAVAAMPARRCRRSRFAESIQVLLALRRLALITREDNVKAVVSADLPITPRFSPTLIGRQKYPDEPR